MMSFKNCVFESLAILGIKFGKQINIFGLNLTQDSFSPDPHTQSSMLDIISE